MSGGGSGGGFGNTDAAAAIGRRLMSGMSATEAVAAETSVDQDPADAASRWVAESLLPMFVAFVQGPDRLKQLEAGKKKIKNNLSRTCPPRIDYPPSLAYISSLSPHRHCKSLAARIVTSVKVLRCANVRTKRTTLGRAD